MNSLKIVAVAAALAAGTAFADTPPATSSSELEPQKSVTMPEFRSLDINGDGKVSEQEAQANAAVWEQFATLDADKNGSLSTNEYAKAQGKAKTPKTEGTQY